MIHTILVDDNRDLYLAVDRIRKDVGAWIFAIPSESMPTTATWYRRLEEAIETPGLKPGTVFFPKMNTWIRGEQTPQFLFHESRTDVEIHRSIGRAVEMRGGEDTPADGLRGAFLFKVEEWVGGIGPRWLQVVPGGVRFQGAVPVLLGRVYLYTWGEVLRC